MTHPIKAMLTTALAATTLLGCIVDDDQSMDLFGSTERGLQADFALGDVNRDGTVNGKDAVAYIKGFGIRLHTYAITDDVYNRGDNLNTVRRVEGELGVAEPSLALPIPKGSSQSLPQQLRRKLA